MSRSSGDVVARKRKRTAASAPARTCSHVVDDADSGEERHDREQPERYLGLSDSQARHPGQDPEELVTQIRPGEDLTWALADELFDGGDLVRPEALAQPDDPG